MKEFPASFVGSVFMLVVKDSIGNDDMVYCGLALCWAVCEEKM